MSFTPLGDTLQNRMQDNAPLKKQIETAEVIEVATNIISDLFGAGKVASAKPLFLKNRTITISCTSSAIAQEIRLHQAEIVEKINEALGRSEVDRIRYLA